MNILISKINYNSRSIVIKWSLLIFILSFQSLQLFSQNLIFKPGIEYSRSRFIYRESSKTFKIILPANEVELTADLDWKFNKRFFLTVGLGTGLNYNTRRERILNNGFGNHLRFFENVDDENYISTVTNIYNDLLNIREIKFRQEFFTCDLSFGFDAGQVKYVTGFGVRYYKKLYEPFFSREFFQNYMIIGVTYNISSKIEISLKSLINIGTRGMGIKDLNTTPVVSFEMRNYFSSISIGSNYKIFKY